MTYLEDKKKERRKKHGFLEWKIQPGLAFGPVFAWQNWRHNRLRSSIVRFTIWVQTFITEHRILCTHSRTQRPRSFWSALKITTSGQVQLRKSAIHGLPVTLRMFWVKSDKSDWFWSQSIVFTKPFKTGMSLDRARGRDFQCWPKGSRPLGTRILCRVLREISAVGNGELSLNH